MKRELFKEQDRWDEDYGSEYLRKMQADPESFKLSLEELPRHKRKCLETLSDVSGKVVLDLGLSLIHI